MVMYHLLLGQFFASMPQEVALFWLVVYHQPSLMMMKRKYHHMLGDVTVSLVMEVVLLIVLECCKSKISNHDLCEMYQIQYH